MSSRTFYSIFAFTVAFMLGLVANWMMTREYVSAYQKPAHCPYAATRTQTQPAHRTAEWEYVAPNPAAADDTSEETESSPESGNCYSHVEGNR